MKLTELKTNVYAIAGVNTTRQLKAKYSELKSLDLRRKVSWEKALTTVQKEQGEFQDWVDNPSKEYKELFAEIEKVSAEYGQKLVEVRHLSQEVRSMADSLEQLANECQDEADQLKQEVKITRRIAKHAHLN